jgi:Skp family chaperone for outer membrane proteins
MGVRGADKKNLQVYKRSFHMEPIREALNKPGVVVDRWVLRLGKNSEEAGRFQPWFLPSSTFEQDFSGFVACLNLLKIVDAVKERMSTQAKGVRAAKKLQREAQKALDKAEAKAKRAQEKAQLKLDRAAEKERIKADAKKAREEAKSAKISTKTVLDTVRPAAAMGSKEVSVGREEETRMSKDNRSDLVSPVEDYPEMTEQVRGILEEARVERKILVVPEEG